MDLVLVRSPLLLLLALCIAAGFAWWTYTRMVPRVPTRQRGLLAGLRFATLGILLILLFEPILQRTTARDEAPVLAVLVDATRSLAPHDTGGVGAATLLATLREMPPISGEMALFRFAADTQPIEGPLDELAFDGARTDISRALEQVRQRLDGRNLRGVLLISDGRYNTGRNPLHLADRYPVPVYTVTVGDTTRPRDVLIADVVTNDIAYAGVELPIRVSVQADGFAGQSATVAVSERGRVLGRQTITLPPDGLQQTVDLAVTPEQEGLRRYTISVTEFDDEATHANNSAGVSVRVLSARRRVLLLAATPGPDLSTLRQELELDPNLEIDVRTPRRDGAYYEGDFPSRLADYDLAILLGFPGPATPPGHASAVASAAEEGLPLLFILSQQTDLSRLASALGDVLPARPTTVRTAFLEGQIAPTGPGASHPILAIPGAPAGGLERLPPVLLNESRWTAAPDARVLATTRVRGIALDDPLLAVRQRGRARSGAILAAGTWRWRNLPADLDDLAGFYPGLTQNLIRWLTSREDDRPVRVRATQDLFDTTEPARFTGQVYDETLEPVSDADVHLTITTPEGTELPFPMRPLGNGRFDVDAGALPEGDYAYTARAERQGVPLGEDRGSFAVGTLDLELRNLTADHALMAELARRSGGEAFFPDELTPLAASLEERMVPRAVETTSDTELRRLTPLLALIIVLLAGEWVVRKRAGMV